MGQQLTTSKVEYLEPEKKRERKGAIVDRELRRIYKKHDVVTAELVLEAATKKTSPLHSYFIWNDQIAAHRYRLAQAYGMILASRFLVQLVRDGKADARMISETASVRSLVNVFRGEGFRMRVDALRETESRAAIVAAKKSQLRHWCASVVDLDELAPLRDQILASL